MSTLRVVLAHAVCMCVVCEVHRLSPGVGSLRATVASVVPGDTIVVSAGRYGGVGYCGITISVPRVKLVGVGWPRVSCAGAKRRHLTIEAEDFDMEGLVLENGVSTGADGGGCLLVLGYAATIKDVSCVGCVAAIHGGGISIVDAVNGTTLLSNVTVRNSSAVSVPGVAGVGGAISVSGSDVVLVGSRITGNRGGGISCVSGSLALRGRSVFENNTGSYGVDGQGGGAIYLADSAVEITDDALFVGNSALWGGAVFAVGVSTLRIGGRARFERNWALRGGAVCGFDSGTLIWVDEDAVFVGNRGTVGDTPYLSFPVAGGAIYLLGGNLSVSGNAVFIGNTVPDGAAGGAICMALQSSRLDVDGWVTFKDNVGMLGGGIFMAEGFVSVSGHAKFENNSALHGGGAIGVQDGVLEVGGGVIFVRNWAGREGRMSFEQAGGSVYAWGGYTVPPELYSIYVWVPDMFMFLELPVCGGAIYAEFSEVTVSGNVSFNANSVTAGGSGAAIYMMDPGSVLRVVDSVSFVGNYADNGVGGAIYMRFCVAYVGGSALFWNNSGKDGGAIYAQASELMIAGASSFVANRAAGSGGAIALRSVNVQRLVVLEDALFHMNTALFGGAVFVNATEASIGCCVRFLQNRAWRDGGGIYSEGFSDLRISDSLFLRNEAARYGGALFCSKNDMGGISSSRFSGNLVTPGCRGFCGGGGVAGAGISARRCMNSTGFDNNSAAFGGAILAIEAAGMELESVHFRGNVAAVDGGGLASVNQSSVAFSGNVSFLGGSAVRGGGLYSSGVGLQVGGALLFRENVAGGEGGGVYTFSPVAVLEGSRLRLEGNGAGMRGGAVLASGGMARLTVDFGGEVVLEGNYAHLDGGAVYLRQSATLTLLSESCPTGCVPEVRGDGVCDPACLHRACNWDEGDCSPVFQNAGVDSTRTCDRSQCSQEQQESAPFASGCWGPCFNSSCDWSMDVCVVAKASIRECLLFDLVVFDNRTFPRLPGRGRDYDPVDFFGRARSLSSMSSADLVGSQGFVGCATSPLRFLNNSALGGHGGAVYQSGCDAAHDVKGVCFFTGLTRETGAMLVEFRGNYAGGSGGAVYTECETVTDTCLSLMGVALGVPALRSASWSLPSIFFHMNSARGHGRDVATAPSRLGVTRERLAYTPGQTALDLTLSLVDGLGQMVRGSESAPLPYVASLLLCPPDRPACSYSDAILGPWFRSFDAVSGVLRTVPEGNQTIVCPLNRSAVLAVVSLFGSVVPGLSRTVEVACDACSAGQSRTEAGVGWTCRSCSLNQYVVDPNRHPCRQCAVGAVCDGSSAVGVDGSTWEVLGDTVRVRTCPRGSVLVRDRDNCTTVPGVSVCSSGPELDRCYRCPGTPYPGFFSVRNASFADGALVAANASSVLDLCVACVKGANCEQGGDSVVALPGFWKRAVPAAQPGGRRAPADTPVPVEIYRCLPGSCLGADRCREGQTGFLCGVCLPNHTHSGDRCVKCPDDQSMAGSRVAAIVTLTLAFALVWYMVALKPFMGLLCPAEAAPVVGVGPKSAAARFLEALKNNRPRVAVVGGIVKILFTFFQVTSCFWDTFVVPWPNDLSTFFAYSAVVKADIFTIPSIACLSQEWDRVARLLFYTVTPPVLILLLASPTVLARVVCRGSLSTEPFRRLEASFYNAFMVFLFTIYPICSIAVLDVYNCVRIGAVSWLSSDLRVVCPYFDGGGVLFWWAIVSTALFPFGIPLILVWCLYRFEVPRMAREKTKREGLNAMLAKFQDDHRESLLGEYNVDSTVCALVFSVLEHRSSETAGMTMALFVAGDGAVSRDTFVSVILKEFRTMQLNYEESLLEQDCAGIFKHFSRSDGASLSVDEFARLSCALCPSRHDDLTPQQITALTLHNFEGRLGSTRVATPAKKKKTVFSSRVPLTARDKLVRHCLYLQEEEILTVNSAAWDESDAASPVEKTAISCMGFLFLDYKVQHWYYELVEQLRKLLMTSVVVFLFPGSLYQIVGGILITFLGLVLCFRMRPYARHQHNSLQGACLTIQGITLFYGLILVAENPDNTAPIAPTAVSLLVLLLNISVVLIPFIQFFLLRTPPHGRRPVWERILELLPCGLRVGRRASTVQQHRCSGTIVLSPLDARAPA